MGRVRSFALILALLGMLAAPVRSAEPVQINVILPLTGSGALLGGGARTGLGVVEKRVNAIGGIGGRPVSSSSPTINRTRRSPFRSPTS